MSVRSWRKRDDEGVALVVSEYMKECVAEWKGVSSKLMGIKMR